MSRAPTVEEAVAWLTEREHYVFTSTPRCNIISMLQRQITEDEDGSVLKAERERLLRDMLNPLAVKDAEIARLRGLVTSLGGTP